MHVVTIPLLKCKSKDPADCNNYWPIIVSAISIALSKVLSRSGCRDFLGTCGLQTAKLVSRKLMGQKWPYFHSSKQFIFTEIKTHMYTFALLIE